MFLGILVIILCRIITIGTERGRHVDGVRCIYNQTLKTTMTLKSIICFNTMLNIYILFITI